MKATNYLEIVGLVLIGFTLDRIINDTGNLTTSIAIDIGLSNDWNSNRFWFIAIICTLIALSLVILQNFELEEYRATTIGAAWKDLKREFFALNKQNVVKVLRSLSFSLQIMIPLLLTVLYDARMGAALFIGFVFVDASIIIERHIQKQRVD